MNGFSQGGFDNPTRALYIFDLAKYIDYGPGFADSSSFRIGVLLGDYNLVDELGTLAQTRTRIQDKPVVIIGFRNIESITPTQVLYLDKNAEFNLDRVKSKIAGHQTMLITEGFEFRESMMNFIVVNGKPRFDINEEMIKKEGMTVPPDLLFMAIKTKEDWQNLFDIASKEIEVQKETINQQFETIVTQKLEIFNQKALLDSLDKADYLKRKDIKRKTNILNSQLFRCQNSRERFLIRKRQYWFNSIKFRFKKIRFQSES